ncbi:hypothetical protein WICMUC_004491 [Wickerhamomyces mucosus]|uniref:C2H2-type domain-containing protein n=1 Tax=Wickerhamomyces mucosus TaxID=1378264 RepID=A0A9P8PIS2_9ASCO|nr:hypothetical protein WICMUC_004491 [Wickerhamomyces mucosus]
MIDQKMKLPSIKELTNTIGISPTQHQHQHPYLHLPQENLNSVPKQAQYQQIPVIPTTQHYQHPSGITSASDISSNSITPPPVLLPSLSPQYITSKPINNDLPSVNSSLNSSRNSSIHSINDLNLPLMKNVNQASPEQIQQAQVLQPVHQIPISQPNLVYSNSHHHQIKSHFYPNQQEITHSVPLQNPQRSNEQNFQAISSPDSFKKKRPRRKANEMIRLYACNYKSCQNSYGTLNHLNAHIQFKKHGQKRKPEEFKQIRELYKLKKKLNKDISEGREESKEELVKIDQLPIFHQQRGYNGYGRFDHTLGPGDLDKLTVRQ